MTKQVKKSCFNAVKQMAKLVNIQILEFQFTLTELSDIFILIKMLDVTFL